MSPEKPLATVEATARTQVRVSKYSPQSVARNLEAALSFWRDIHPRVTRHAREFYEAGDFTRAINQALKSVHALVQDRVKIRAGIDLDGETLMNRTFTPGRPIIELDDVSTSTGRNTQHGFMQLFAGSMTGFADPLCGGRRVPDDRQARHVIYLASLLMYKLDDSSSAHRSVTSGIGEHAEGSPRLH